MVTSFLKSCTFDAFFVASFCKGGHSGMFQQQTTDESCNKSQTCMRILHCDEQVEIPKERFAVKLQLAHFLQQYQALSDLVWKVLESIDVPPSRHAFHLPWPIDTDFAACHAESMESAPRTCSPARAASAGNAEAACSRAYAGSSDVSGCWCELSWSHVHCF